MKDKSEAAEHRCHDDQPGHSKEVSEGADGAARPVLGAQRPGAERRRQPALDGFDRGPLGRRRSGLRQGAALGILEDDPAPARGRLGSTGVAGELDDEIGDQPDPVELDRDQPARRIPPPEDQVEPGVPVPGIPAVIDRGRRRLVRVGVADGLAELVAEQPSDEKLSDPEQKIAFGIADPRRERRMKQATVGRGHRHLGDRRRGSDELAPTLGISGRGNLDLEQASRPVIEDPLDPGVDIRQPALGRGAELAGDPGPLIAGAADRQPGEQPGRQHHDQPPAER